VLTLGDSLYTAGPNGLAIGLTTLAPQGAVAIVGGSVLSLGSHFVVVDGNVIPYTSMKDPTSVATFSLQGTLYTAAPTGVVIGGVTLKPGGQGATISGQYVTAGPQGVVIGKSTVSYTAQPPMTTVTGGVFTLGARPYTFISGSGMVIGTVTLTAGGPAMMVSGVPVSVAEDGVIVGTDSFVMSTVVRTFNGFVITTTKAAAVITTASGSPTRNSVGSFAVQDSGGESILSYGRPLLFAVGVVILSIGYLLI